MGDDMGAWDTSTLGNDVALDTMAELTSASGWKAVERVLDVAAGEVAQDGGASDRTASAALCAAELVAGALGRPASGVPESMAQWLAQTAPPPPYVLANARRITRAVMHESETRELWLEAGQLDPWLDEVKALMARLGA
ncbi:DUF4259 domain-containing protein [Andreprevotia lacus]|uniref:DUF4259 domain-containing protein n=1 Tax=Andreprevotia lacus TaxID=1121000 RepID=UPI001FEB2C86|nr:DUF4259 domain-containing protein [Andreprevotia lacus]